MTTTRRDFAKNALAVTAAFSLPSFAMAGNKPEIKRLKIVCVGLHPDDAEGFVRMENSLNFAG